MRRSLLAVIGFAAGAAALTFTKNSAAAFDPSVDLTARPIIHAWADFQRDWYKVIGVPVLNNGFPSTTWSGGAYITFAINNSTLGREEFTITAGNNAQYQYDYLQVTAGDMRGLIYGMYHVSCDILGVDAFWWFHDLQPQYAGTITVPDTYSYGSGTPAWYSRGAFFNDEDISGFFFTDPVGDSIYSGEAAGKYAETLLRLRVNTVIPSTFAYIDERHYRAYQDRGLAFGNHHVMPVGVNMYAWPTGVPYTYRLNPEVFHALWSQQTEYQQVTAGREMIYSLGYRGLNDYPFWNDDTACTTDQCRGQTITWAIANQSVIAANTPVGPGVPQPRFVSYMWMELLELKEAGTLVLPAGVSCIWTDFPGSFNIAGIVNASAGDGFYAHLAMMNGVGGQNTEFIKLARAFANMWAFWMKNATAYGMINVSDLKHLPLTAEAVYKYLWNPLAFNQTAAGCPAQSGTDVSDAAKSGSRRVGARGPVGWWPMPQDPTCPLRATPDQAQAAYTLAFTTRHYGSNTTGAQPVPTAVAAIHQAYFNASYMSVETTGSFSNYGDHYFGTTLRGVIGPVSTAVQNGNHSNGLLSYAQQLLSFAGTNLPYMQNLFVNQVLPLQSQIPFGVPSSFYASHVVMQIGLHYWHIQAFQDLGTAIQQWVGNNVPAAVSSLTAAVTDLENALEVMRLGEGQGIWRGVYAQEWWTWVWGTRAQMANLLAHAQGLHTVAAPQSIYPDNAFMTYECPIHDSVKCNSFPFSNFNASIAWDVMVRVTCAADAPHASGMLSTLGSHIAAQKRSLRPAAAVSSSEGDSCTTSVVGVFYSGASTQVALFTAPNPGRGRYTAPTIRYTTDGTPVGPGSTVYTAPFAVSGNATVRAQAFDAISGAALISESLATITQAKP